MLDLDNFVGGFDLERAMDEFRNNMTYGGKLKFYSILKNSKYLMPYSENKGIALISSAEGKSFLPIFTHAKELTKQVDMAGDKIRIMSFRDILNLFIEHYPKIMGVALNPFGKTLFLGKEQIDDIESFTEGMTLRRTDYEKPQELLKWQNISEEMKKHFLSYCRQEKFITRAWIVGARRNKSEEPHIQFLIEFYGVKREEIFNKVAEIVREYMLPGQSFELMQATEESANRASIISEAIYEAHNVGIS